MVKDPGARFAELVQREADIPLDQGALLIAAHAYGDLDLDEELARLDALAESCPSADLAGLRSYLFEELGFGGDARRYSDPRSSFLNEVVRRRRGIPISLSVLTIEVGRRVGVVLHGVGMPGHFLVGHEGDPAVLLDPFGGGRIVDRKDAELLFRSLYGPAATFHESMLRPVGPRAILTRTLLNLRQLYVASGDARAVGWVLRLRTLIPAATPEEKVDQASAHAALGRVGEAAALMEEVAELVYDEEIATQARTEAQLLRSRLN